MAGWMAEHKKARQICPPGPCAQCGAAKTEVHHVNHDWKDHRPENLRRLCRSCHMKAHRGNRQCSLCDRPHKGLGYCEMHYQRFKTHGDPMMLGDYQSRAQQKRRGTLGQRQLTKREVALKRWRSEG